MTTLFNYKRFDCAQRDTKSYFNLKHVPRGTHDNFEFANIR